MESNSVPMGAIRRGSRVLIACAFAAALLPVIGAAKAPEDETGETWRRGQRIAGAIATVTGTAISPLLGVAVLGAFQYAKTPEVQRASLPFYCAPAFWIPVAILVVMILLKDTVGSAVPLLKKPLDAVEVLLLNKAALLFALLPVVWHQAAVLNSLYGTTASISPAVHTAGITIGDGAFKVFTLVIGTAIAFVVWLCGHAIDILALLSPIPLLDLLLKGFRVTVYAVIAVVTAISVKAGFILSLLVIGVCLMCFWWAFRL